MATASAALRPAHASKQQAPPGDMDGSAACALPAVLKPAAPAPAAPGATAAAGADGIDTAREQQQHNRELPVSHVDEMQAVLAGLAATSSLAAVRAEPRSISDAFAPQPPPATLDWAALPAAVDAGSTGMGVSTRASAKQRAKRRPADAAKIAARVARKRAQVESFLVCLEPLLVAAGHTRAGLDSQPPPQQQQPPPPVRIVDFGCGSGNLLLPLAALFPTCSFVGVDMKPAALDLLLRRAAAAGLHNVSVHEGMIESFHHGPVDVALALHACGSATDVALQMAVEREGAAFIVSPCCVGKLRFSLAGGSSFCSQPLAWTPQQPGDRPTGVQQADPGAPPALRKLQHPRSAWLRQQLPQAERHFGIMASIADASHTPQQQALLAEALAQRASVAICCKRLIELDRCAAAAEAGYAVGLFKVLRADEQAKNDLLLGLPLPHAARRPGADALPFRRCLEASASRLVARGVLFTAADLAAAPP